MGGWQKIAIPLPTRFPLGHAGERHASTIGRGLDGGDGGQAAAEGSQMSQTPVSLLERLRQPGAQEAWERFIEIYSPLICAWTRQAAVREQDAGDLVQDVLLTLEHLKELTNLRELSLKGTQASAAGIAELPKCMIEAP